MIREIIDVIIKNNKNLTCGNVPYKTMSLKHETGEYKGFILKKNKNFCGMIEIG